MTTNAECGIGLYRKFMVQRADGSSAPGGKHEECSYFVLDWDHDPFAVPAARAYADACEATYPALASELRALANRHAARWATPTAVSELLQAALDMEAPPQTNNEEVERRRRAEATTRFEKLAGLVTAPNDHAKRLAEIEALERAATKGPWRRRGSLSMDSCIESEATKDGVPLLTVDIDASVAGDVEARANGDFIAHAREDVPWLFAQLRAASEALDAAGVPAGPLGERVRACTRDGGWRDQWEALRQAKDADDIARARATRDVDILRRAARAAAVSFGEFLPDDAGPEAIAAALRRATQARVQPTMLTVAIPDLGIVTARGDTAQALAEDVASQVIHVVRTYALAAPESLAEDAIVLRAKVRARLGLDGE